MTASVFTGMRSGERACFANSCVVFFLPLSTQCGENSGELGCFINTQGWFNSSHRNQKPTLTAGLNCEACHMGVDTLKVNTPNQIIIKPNGTAKKGKAKWQDKKQ